MQLRELHELSEAQVVSSDRFLTESTCYAIARNRLQEEEHYDG